MKRNYRISGLDCASCAIGLEKGIKKIQGVKSININYMLLKLSVEVDDNNSEEILNKVVEYASKFEAGLQLKRI